MKNRIVSLILPAALLLFALPAFSLSLDEAKNKGLVGETPSGYLAAVHAPSKEVNDLLQDVNAKRKRSYASIAERNGTPVTAVEQLAGKSAVEKTAPGNYVQLPSGEWVKKS